MASSHEIDFLNYIRNTSIAPEDFLPKKKKVSFNTRRVGSSSNSNIVKSFNLAECENVQKFVVRVRVNEYHMGKIWRLYTVVSNMDKVEILGFHYLKDLTSLGYVDTKTSEEIRKKLVFCLYDGKYRKDRIVFDINKNIERYFSVEFSFKIFE